MIVCFYVRNSLAGRIGCAELVACSPGISLPLGSERGLKRGATLCPSSHPVLVESSAFGKGDHAMKVIGNLDEHTDGCWPALDPVSCHRGRGPFVFGTRPNLFQGCLPARRARQRTGRATRSWPGQLHEARRLRRHVRTAGWWESVHHTGEIDEGLITESTLLDYVRFQSAQQTQLSGSTINQRVAVADRALRAVPGFVELITSIQST